EGCPTRPGLNRKTREPGENVILHHPGTDNVVTLVELLAKLEFDDGSRLNVRHCEDLRQVLDPGSLHDFFIERLAVEFRNAAVGLDRAPAYCLNGFLGFIEFDFDGGLMCDTRLRENLDANVVSDCGA